MRRTAGTLTDCSVTSLADLHGTTDSGYRAFNLPIASSEISYTNNLDPAGSLEIKLPAMGNPMIPRPTKPTDVGVLLILDGYPEQEVVLVSRE